MKRVFPFLECGMCGRANDNMCDACDSFQESLLPQCLNDIHEQTADAPDERIFIGSGEDGHLWAEHKDTLYANYNKEYA